MAFDTIFTINSITGNDTTGDGITIPVATAAKASTLINADATRANKYTIVVETDLINDFFNFVDTPNSLNVWIKIVYANGVKHYSTTSQTGAVINNAGSGSQGGALWVIGAKISGFIYAISDGAITNFTGQYRDGKNIFEDCDLEGYVHLPRMHASRFNRCRVRTGIVHSTNGDATTWCLTYIKHCDLRGANQFYNTGTTTVPIWTIEPIRIQNDTGNVQYDGFNSYLGHNDFDGCGDITINLKVGQTYGKFGTTNLSYMLANNWNGCNVNFSTSLLAAPATFAAATDATAMRAKALADGITLASNWFENELFGAISYDSFDFQNSEINYILNNRVGINRYAISQATPEANPNLTDMGGYYVTTAATSIVYTLELQQGRNIRRAILHINRTGANEQLGENGQVELSIETSHDGVTYGSATTYLSGIDASTLDFDFMGVGAKKVRITATNTGGFGEIQYLGATIETNTLEDRLSQTDTRTLYAAGTVPVNVLSLQNKSNLLTLADFTQVNTINQFRLKPVGGLISPAGISAMLVPFAGNQILTKLSFGGWIKVPNLTTPTGGDRFYALISNWNLFTGNVADEGFRIGIFNSVVFRVDYCNGVNYRFINTPVVSLTEFNNLYANKYVHIFSTFENGLAKLYINAVLVASTQMSITSVKTNTTVQQIYLGRSIVNSAYVPTNTEIDEPQLFFNRVITADQLSEIIRVDQHNHKYLRV